MLRIIMSLDRAMTHRPAATGASFRPSRQIRRELELETCTFPGTGSPRPASGNGKGQSSQNRRDSTVQTSSRQIGLERS